MTEPVTPGSIGTVAGRSIGILCGAALVVPLGWVIVSPVVPVTLRLILAGLWLTAALSPYAALVALALLAPFGSAALAAFDAPPVQYTEALVLATLSGAAIAAARGRHAAARVLSPSVALPAAAFSGVVICSLAVVLAVSQVGIGVRWPFVRGVAIFLARDYLLGPSEQWVSLGSAARLLEGVLLLLIVVRQARADARWPLHILSATAVAGAIAAGMAISQLASTMGALGSFPDLVARLLTSRVGANVRDTNAAGSFFAMTAFIAAALALTPGARAPIRRIWSAVATALFLATWLTGSRAAVLSVVVVLLAIAAWVAWRGSRRRSVWWLAAIGVVCVVGAVAVGFDPRAMDRRGLLNTVEERGAFVTTGLRMIAAAPAFGIGIGRYLEVSGGFMPQSIYWFHLRENAHNNFLQVGGELGLAGLATFVWLLAASWVRVRRGRQAGDRLLDGAIAGLAAFVVTWMAGHPLLTPEVAFPFWILVGAAVARADGHRRAPPVVSAAQAAIPATIGRRRRRGARLMAGLTIVLLIATVPLRVRREAAALDLSGQSFGLYAWEADPVIGRLRWTSPSAAFFVSAHTNEIDVPINAAYAERKLTPTVVTFAVDGRVFHKHEPTASGWSMLRLRVPPPLVRGHQYRRVDITTEPRWSPAAVLGIHDSRVLGVQLGDVVTR